MLLGIFYGRTRDAGIVVNIFNAFSIRAAVAFLANVALLYILFRFQFWLLLDNKHKRKKTLLAVFGSIALLFIISPIFANIQWWLFRDHMPSSVYLMIQFIKDLVLLLVTFLFTALLLSLNKTQKTIVENQKLMVENLQNKYDALKNQVDPHFLFNSLNTLNGLIGFDDEKAHEYVDQLASVFRYTMQNKPVICLEDELEFVKSYAYLMQIRYGESFRLEYNIDEKYLKYHILPFGLQLLIENAVKHNVISKKYPLLITIETTGDELVRVKNNLQQKNDQKSSGVGLANLNERYHLMFDRIIGIDQTNDLFIVEIPLVKEYDNTKTITQ